MPAEPPAPRVLHLRSSCGFYGAESAIYNLVRAYPGEAVTVCLEDRRDPHVELCERLGRDGHVVETLASAGPFDPGVLVRFSRLLRKHRPAVIHSHDYKSDAIAWLVARRHGYSVVSTLHGNLKHTAALKRYEKADAWALRRFDRVAAVSEDRMREALAYGVPPARVEVVINGVDTDLFRPMPHRAELRERLGIPSDGLLVGVTGRLSEEKGHGVLMQAVCEPGNSAAGIRLLFVGDGPMEPALRGEAATLGIGDRVHFAGRRDDMPEVYSALDTVALPSLTEGLPMTVIEAAACGRPIIATNVGAVAKVVLDGETGYLVPPGDAQALAKALNGILQRREHAERMGAAARTHAVQHFSARAMAEAYRRFYEKALGRPEPASAAPGASR